MENREKQKQALEKELIETHASYVRADNFLRKGYDFHIKALKDKLKSLNHGKESK